MRRTLLAPLLSALLLVACQMTSPDAGTGLADGAIAVTALDAPADAQPVDTKPADAQPADAQPTDAQPADAQPVDTKPVDTKPADAQPADAQPADAAKPGDPAKPTDPVTPADPVTPTDAAISEPAAPAVAKTAEQQLCEKSKGQWVSAGDTGAFYCASMTRDGGKQCRKKTECEGVCLARSGTCSPITPLYGCNDVLEKDGRMVTLCVN